ncbi:MAG: hypothetical protein ACE5EG_11725, partial [Thermoanaerobaculia bacterium]
MLVTLCALAGIAAAPPAGEPLVLDPFEDTTPLQAERLRGLRPEIARRILRGAPGGEIALAVTAYPTPAAAGRSRVALFVEIDGATFLSSNQSRTAQVEIYAYALTAAGVVDGYLAEAFALDVGRQGERVWSGGLRFVGWLELPAGDYELRVLVHNARSLAHGMVFAALEVPAVAPDRPSLLPPVFVAPRLHDSRLPIRGRGGWQTAVGPVYPFSAAGQALLPLACPVLVSGRRASAYLLAERLPLSKPSGWLELLGDRTGNSERGERPVIGRAPLELVEPEDGDGRLASRRVGFFAPAAPPGRYDLRLTLHSPTGTLTTPTLEVLLVEAEPQDRGLVWSDLRALESPAMPVPEPETVAQVLPVTRDHQVPKSRGVRRLATRYRQAVAASLAADGGRPTPLIDFELAALGRSGEEQLTRLRTAELLVAAALGRQQADLLLPLIALHDELFRLYRRRQIFSLVAHSRRLIESLAEFYAELGGDS